MPCRICEKNGFEISGTVTRSLPDRNVRRFLPAAFGTYPSNSTAFITLLRVRGLTISGRVSTRDTVAVETPARFATSKMLDGEGSGIDGNHNTPFYLLRLWTFVRFLQTF